MGKYWWSVAKVGWSAFVARLREGRRNIIIWTIQTTVIFGLLYLVPWLGDVVGEAKTTGAAVVGAVIASCVLTLAWEILKAPWRMSVAQAADIKSYSEQLRLNHDAEAIRSEGMMLFDIGRQAYIAAHGDDRDRSFRSWERDVTAYIEKYYSGFELINFQTGSRFDPRELDQSLDKEFAEKLDRLLYTINLSSPAVVQNKRELGFNQA